MTKDDVSAALEEIGTLLALQGENDFRTKAYTNAARTVSQLPGDINVMLADGTLSKVRGIGEALLEKITTLLKTGRLPYLEELRSQVPPGHLAMLRINGVGPKKVKALYDSLGIETLDELRAACQDGRVAGLKGFGEKTAAKIIEGLDFLGTVGNRVRFDQAFPLGEALVAELAKLPGVVRAQLCGSLRRRRETVKDIDIVVSSVDAEPIMAAFIALPQVMKVVNHGATKSSIIASMTSHGETIVLNADLRVVTDEQFPVTILHFTGSKEHNIRLRQRAIERGMSLNEYALTKGDEIVPITEEAEVYAALGLVFVPPEMREDAGEIELSETKALPKLIEPSDLRGVFHNHTVASDGRGTLEEMALAAKALGWEYFGVGDHSQSLTVANGLSPERVRAQWAEIDALNKKLSGITILKGIESDILLDGSLDYDDELLAGFDYVVGSVHSHFNLPEAEQTARICKALAHPALTILGHPTGRLLLRRDGYKVNMETILQAAKKHGKIVEINAQPERLDLDWKDVIRAKALGIKLVINPDAHATGELALTSHGIHVARRGHLTKADVFNTKTLKELLKTLKTMHAKS
jgi:DNA polymerase (family X)